MISSSTFMILPSFLNYERATTEPRFRHAKLREIALNGDFKTVYPVIPPDQWNGTHLPKIGFVFDRRRLSESEKISPDLVSNILPNSAQRHLRNLDPKDLELCYWQ